MFIKSGGLSEFDNINFEMDAGNILYQGAVKGMMQVSAMDEF